MPAPAKALEPKQARSRATRKLLLDAAVAELVEHGYAGLTGQAVAQRAGISRGAQQNHFPSRMTMVTEAVRHLGQTDTKKPREIIGREPPGPRRLRVALDVIFEQYSGGRFAAIVELSLAARREPELGEVIASEERAIGRETMAVAGDIFEPDWGGSRQEKERWATALSTIRGLALLKLLGHPVGAVDRQWAATRRDLIALLTQPLGQG